MGWDETLGRGRMDSELREKKKAFLSSLSFLNLRFRRFFHRRLHFSARVFVVGGAGFFVSLPGLD